MFAYVSDTNAWLDVLGLSYEEVREVQKGKKILDLIRSKKRNLFRRERVCCDQKKKW